MEKCLTMAFFFWANISWIILASFNIIVLIKFSFVPLFSIHIVECFIWLFMIWKASSLVRVPPLLLATTLRQDVVKRSSHLFDVAFFFWFRRYSFCSQCAIASDRKCWTVPTMRQWDISRWLRFDMSVFPSSCLSTLSAFISFSNATRCSSFVLFILIQFGFLCLFKFGKIASKTRHNSFTFFFHFSDVRG